MGTKNCSTCGQEKTLSDFAPDSRYALGVKGQCRVCVAAYRRKRRKDNPDIAEKHRRDALERHRKRMAGPEAKAAKEAKREYDREYRRKNRERLRDYEKTLRVRDPDMTRAIKKSYRARRRAIERNGMSGPELAAWQEAQPKVCHWCGCSCDEGFHVDHYVPLSGGGKHQPENLVMSCSPCNLRKNATHPAEFAASIGRLL